MTKIKEIEIKRNICTGLKEYLSNLENVPNNISKSYLNKSKNPYKFYGKRR